MQPLGLNKDGYHGQRIDVGAVLETVRGAAARLPWERHALPVAEGLELLTLHRPASTRVSRRVYISTGIHGDEPAGPLAALRLLERNDWPDACDVWLCPCLNPTGFPDNRRENVHGHDLNRDYRHPRSPETCAHVGWMARLPSFDLCLCLHEDWEAKGFYLYELNPDHAPSLAHDILRAASEFCPVDPSPEIEGRRAEGGVIRPNHDPDSRPDWPEALYLIHHKTRLSYTLEAPSDFPLDARVNALAAAAREAVWRRM